MTQNNTSSKPVCESCGLRHFERNQYFDGKLLVTRDFEDEQSYLRGKDRLHSSMLHGEGAVCGLKLTEHPNPACQHQFVVLNPGLALDCCGNEIIVPDEIVVDLRQMIEDSVGIENLTSTDANGDTQLVPTDIYIRAAYQECGTEMVPALLNNCDCDEHNTEHNRTRESYKLVVSTEPPAGESSDPLDARLQWQHTLTMASPRAIAVDRNLMRLYVAEWDGVDSWLRMYDSSNHRLIERVRIGDQGPTAIALSNLGDLVYVAVAPDAGNDGRVVIFDQNRLETDPVNSARASLPLDPNTTAIRLDVSALDDSLFVLTDTGQVLRWRGSPIRDWVNVDGAVGAAPTPDTQELNEVVGGVVAPNDMSIGPNGRWLVVTETNEDRIFALSLAQFGQGGAAANRINSFDLPQDDAPAAIRFSYDGDFVYILCTGNGQKLYRATIRSGAVEPELATFIPNIPDERDKFTELPLVDDPTLGSPPNPEPLDLAVSPRDNWVYILRRLFDVNGNARDIGDVLTVDVSAMNDHLGQLGPIDQAVAVDIRSEAANIEGNAQFQNLAFLGQRLYVAGETVDDTGSPVAPPEGSVSILFVDEASCDTFIHQTIEGCPECDH